MIDGKCVQSLVDFRSLAHWYKEYSSGAKMIFWTEYSAGWKMFSKFELATCDRLLLCLEYLTV